MADKSEQDVTDDTETFIKMASGDTKTRLIEEFEIEKEKKVNFTGLSKDEVLKYATDPTWVKIRWIIFAIFWLLWLGMLVAAVLLIVLQPRCPYKPRLDWWQKDVIYQVDIAKFYDSNGDGVGDLAGLNKKLDYINDLGVRSIALSNAIDEADTMKLKSVYGDANLLQEFRKALKSRFMHLIIDIPIHYIGLTDIDLKVNASKTVSHWLNNYADGIRLTHMERLKDLTFNKNDPLDSIIYGLRETADAISKRTLNKKLILFSSNEFELNFKLQAYNPHFIINPLFKSTDLTNDLSTPETLIDTVRNAEQAIKTDAWPSTMFSCARNPRLGNLAKSSSSVINLSSMAQTLLILLRGTPIVLYGDELGLPSSADGKSPGFMQWDSSTACGFTTNETVASIAFSKKCDSSVQRKTAHGAGDTIVDLFTHLVKLRSKEAFAFGENQILNETKVFSFIRYAKGFPSYLVATHFNSKSTEPHLINFHSSHNVAQSAVVEYYYSANSNIQGNSDFHVNKSISTDKILLKYGEILILELQQ